MNKELNNRLRHLSNDASDEVIEDIVLLEKEFNVSIILLSFSTNCHYIAYDNIFNKQNIIEAKQYLFLSGKALIYMATLFDNDLLPEIMSVTAILLSDNNELISQFSQLRPSNEAERISNFLNVIYCVQAVLREDWEYLQELNSYTKYNIENQRGWKQFYPDLIFFEAILDKDRIKMKEAINLLATKWHKRRNDSPLYSHLISLPALTYAKLAYIKGFELEIDHPLIPKELLKIQPNDEYWECDFMNKGIYKNV